MTRKYPFYSRKYGQFFKDYATFKKYNLLTRKAWVYAKHRNHRLKTYRDKSGFYDKVAREKGYL